MKEKKNNGPKDTGLEIKVKSNANIYFHKCRTMRDGDWIIYRCEHDNCNYEFRENWRTDEFMIRNMKVDVHHSGGYFPDEYKEAFENLN